jgi:hypothetical protein
MGVMHRALAQCGSCMTSATSRAGAQGMRRVW